ncbi:5-dehydro-4-deoxyglucarate dehydratase [Cryobacterium melibiosiphilum]|uniref:Probable 5-dehydro-4-deoxyglucarate dehydratase n=1 Tax=Cryobacterium melibiosiphilum TaxID=995039 RepID=A0A3A5M9Y6_9MICO|nr:5-dehydro-4-deoxyglucarate dehydratase [Cryobacterium melibiosiphilum]RJT85175.1 5-dehydro-4-deoxyglucarate dehydratase [Cryobacterium melibiosiphilum]
MLDGILFFPITPFNEDDTVNHAALTAHLEHGIGYGPGGIFVACGTGEFHTLAVDEFTEIVATTVTVTAGRTPVFAGVGGPIASAKLMARKAAEAGADGLLLLPPYLVGSPVEGLLDYVRAVADASELPIIVYHRGNAQFTVAAAVEVSTFPTVIGFKDGVGDLDLMSRIVRAVEDATTAAGKEFQFFNGLPTAESSQAAYRAIGVELYSSATFAFAPELSVAFYDSLISGDTELTNALSREFFHPLVALRDQAPGYAVALVKAGARLGGIQTGAVRPPLRDITAAHEAELVSIIAAGRRVLADRAVLVG